jgi:predicted secreted hydrolase
VEGYASALEAREFRFPEDHGPHPEYRNEWWYFTGNLDSRSGERFGFELTIFRFLLSPSAKDSTGSAWQTNQVFIGHFAVTDVEGKSFHVAQRYSRGGAGLAGASAEPFRVWIDDWSITRSASSSGEAPVWRIVADDPDFSVDLQLVAEKPVVLNGRDGLSQKSAEPGNASYYYSMPRWRTSGSLRVNDQPHDVTGATWLDREWGSSALARDQQGWDWFALQLSDGSDLMFYVLRDSNGKPHEYSSGTWIDAAGVPHRLSRDDVIIEVTDYWQSEGGGRYPSGWNVDVPARDIEIRVVPVMKDQELVTTVRYWEGAVDVTGTSGNETIRGRGYVELTGYAGN